MNKHVWLAAPFLVLSSMPGQAESCTRSRDYIVEGLAGALTKPARVYQNLFTTCVETLRLSNVKDAFVLKSGAIAVDPARNTVMATSATLAAICQRFPDAAVRFLSPREQRSARTVGLVVMMSSGDATQCRKLRASS